jgi:DNA polymerase
VNESQRRAFRALGIGPLWRRRAPAAPPQAPACASSAACASAEAPRLFALADEGGDWLFVGEATADGASGDGDPLPPDAMRLLGRMLFALGLRPARQAIAFDERADPPEPQVVVALGDRAAHALLDTDAPLASLRGRVHEGRFAQQPVRLVVSAHPSRLLEAAHEKAQAWADLCLARAVLAQDPGAGLDAGLDAPFSACSGRSAPPSRTRADSPDGGG